VQHLWKLGAAAVVVAGIFAAYHFAPDSGPYAGTWKAVVLQPGYEAALCLLHVSGDEHNPRVDVVDAPGFASARVEEARVSDGALRIRLKTERGTFQIVAYAPKDGKAADQLLGSFLDRNYYDLLRLERTNQRELDPKKATTEGPGFADLQRALSRPKPKDQEEAVEGVLKNNAGKPVAQFALLMLAQVQARTGASAETLKATGDRDLEAAASYGREIELQAAARLARALNLLAPKRGAELALEYGRRAEHLLRDDDPPILVVGVYKALAQSLRDLGKNDEAKAMDEKSVSLNAKLDDDFAKNSIKFVPAPPAGRRNASDRVVLAELFTGAQCPPCVAADIAFDAALQVYKPNQVVFLQYHEHIPRADPLTCAASEERLHYYSDIPGTPAVVLDGKLLDESIGGGADRGERSYELFHDALDKALEAPASARLELTARRQGDDVELSANVSNLTRPGERVRLRFVLAEGVVHYAAPNGQRLHHHVVRDFPGGVDGFPLPEKSARATAKVNLAELRKAQRQYLLQAASRTQFMDDEQPIELQHLIAVAFIQDDVSKQVLQAAETEIAGPK
jgi:hypothetical protein